LVQRMHRLDIRPRHALAAAVVLDDTQVARPGDSAALDLADHDHLAIGQAGGGPAAVGAGAAAGKLVQAEAVGTPDASAAVDHIAFRRTAQGVLRVQVGQLVQHTFRRHAVVHARQFGKEHGVVGEGTVAGGASSRTVAGPAGAGKEGGHCQAGAGGAEKLTHRGVFRWKVPPGYVIPAANPTCRRVQPAQSPSRSRSQAWAISQSRWTVRSLTSRVAAISAMSSPRKERSAATL